VERVGRCRAVHRICFEEEVTLTTPIIVRAKSQMAKVEQLAAFIEKLDGSKLKIIEKTGDERPYPTGNNDAFHQAAVEMKGKPFIWMEPDAIPRKEGWIYTLTKAYLESGKEFLLSNDVNPPFDLVGGIGVYGPNTHWLIPEAISSQGWDAWMAKHLKPLTGFTPLIQHSYGNYNKYGIASPHRFPQDNYILRPDAVLFHSDKFQQLIPGSTTKSFYHTGDLGDIIAALPVIRQLGGGELVIGNHGSMHAGWRAMEGARFNAIKPLIEAQSYISSIRFEHLPKGVDFDISGFRNVHSHRCNLSEAQARWLKVSNLNLDPWLNVTPSELSKGRIIVARSARYHNPRFPWKQLIRSYGRRMSFVGLQDEFEAFVRWTGGSGLVTYMPTRSLLEAAALIEGSELFIGNQSCPCWIAMGLGHRMIQETHEFVRDSVVTRESARFFTGINRSCFADLGVPI
jgi:hypothetical protein